MYNFHWFHQTIHILTSYSKKSLFIFREIKRRKKRKDVFSGERKIFHEILHTLSINLIFNSCCSRTQVSKIFHSQENWKKMKEKKWKKCPSIICIRERESCTKGKRYRIIFFSIHPMRLHFSQFSHIERMQILFFLWNCAFISKITKYRMNILYCAL